MRLRIRSDGMPFNTVIEDADTGEMVEGVVRVSWRMNAGEVSEAVLVVERVAFDLNGHSHTSNLDPVAREWLTEKVECHVVDNPGQQS